MKCFKILQLNCERVHRYESLLGLVRTARGWKRRILASKYTKTMKILVKRKIAKRLARDACFFINIFVQQQSVAFHRFFHRMLPPLYASRVRFGNLGCHSINSPVLSSVKDHVISKVQRYLVEKYFIFWDLVKVFNDVEQSDDRCQPTKIRFIRQKHNLWTNNITHGRTTVETRCKSRTKERMLMRPQSVRAIYFIKWYIIFKKLFSQSHSKYKYWQIEYN